MDTLSPKIMLFGKTMNIKEFLTLLYTEAKTSGYDSNTGNVWCLAYQRNVSTPGIPMDQLAEKQRLYVYAVTFLSFFTIGVAGKAPKGNTPRDFIVKTPDYEREFWLSDNINSRRPFFRTRVCGAFSRIFTFTFRPPMTQATMAFRLQNFCRKNVSMPPPIMWRNTLKTGRLCFAPLSLTSGTRMSPTPNEFHLTGAAFGWLLFLLPKIATECIIKKNQRRSMNL